MRFCTWCNKAIKGQRGAMAVCVGHGVDPVPFYDSETNRWTISLNRYQRDNLVWLLCSMLGNGFPANTYGRHEQGVNPFILANSGDWAGEIPNMLGLPSPVTLGSVRASEITPNFSGSMQEKVDEWRLGGLSRRQRIAYEIALSAGDDEGDK